MNIIFKRNENIESPYDKENRIELYPDTSWDSKNRYPWDDFGYATTFHTMLFFEEEKYDLPNIKILIKDKESTHTYFKNIIKDSNENYITFPLEDSYISLPTDIEFYEALKSLFSDEIVTNILEKLSDALIVKNTGTFENRKELLDSDGFKNSLLREMTSRKAFENGWNIFQNESAEKDLTFNLYFQLDNYSNEHYIEINLRKTIFPNNINVLIGSNGTGKSQAISYLIDELLNIGKTQQLEVLPVFNQIVNIAYSPFENFKLSLDNEKTNIKSSYRYFGFRNQNNVFNTIQPNIDSTNSILNMILEDDKKDYIKTRTNKFDTFMRVLRKAINFDFISFKINIETPLIETEFIYNDNVYAKIEREPLIEYIDEYKEEIIIEDGIQFFKNDKLLPLSSGQQIFVQLISNIIGSIRKDTLILLDEPELYLHPNLEVELIDLLKELLDTFNSYAVIATHSAIIAREVPKDYITILKKQEDSDIISISRPPFETIGANLERINSYVFFDKDIAKPYQIWLQNLVNKYGNSKNVIENFIDELNEESIILVQGMEPKNAN